MASPTFPAEIVTTFQAALICQHSRDPGQVLQADMAIRNIILNKVYDVISPVKERNLLTLRQGDPQMLPWVAELLSTVSNDQVLLVTLENANSSNSNFITAERLAWFRRAEAEKLDLEIVPWLAMMRDYNMAEALARYHSINDRSVISLGMYARDIMLAMTLNVAMVPRMSGGFPLSR